MHLFLIIFNHYRYQNGFVFSKWELAVCRSSYASSKIRLFFYCCCNLRTFLLSITVFNNLIHSFHYLLSCTPTSLNLLQLYSKTCKLFWIWLSYLDYWSNIFPISINCPSYPIFARSKAILLCTIINPSFNRELLLQLFKNLNTELKSSFFK